MSKYCTKLRRVDFASPCVFIMKIYNPDLIDKQYNESKIVIVANLS